MEGAGAGRVVNPADDRSAVEAESPSRRAKLRAKALLSNFVCSICTDTLPEHHHVISTCRHHFCYPCIGQNLLCRDVQSYNCPECRQLVPARDRYKIITQFMAGQLSYELRNKVNHFIYGDLYLTDFERKVFDSGCMSKSLASEANLQRWDVNAISSLDGSYLEWLASRGNTGDFSAQLERFISLGIDLNVTDGFGLTPLLSVLRESDDKQLERVRQLLAAGADPNLLNEEGEERPLDCVLKRSHDHIRVDLVRLLLRFGADPGKSVRRGISLHFCRSPADADAILEHCPTLDINYKSESGYTPLAEAATSFNLEMLTYWIYRGADIQCPGVMDCPDLLSAMVVEAKKAAKMGLFQKHLSVIKLLLNVKGWSSACDWQSAVRSVIPVSDKCSPSQLQIVKLLLKAANEASLDVAGYINRDHLLHGAIKCHDSLLVDCLLQAGADIFAEDDSGKLCLDLACDSGNQDILWLVESKCPEADAKEV